MGSAGEALAQHSDGSAPVEEHVELTGPHWAACRSLLNAT